jgi:predicted Holliday junction resolvase-like endonuclease
MSFLLTNSIFIAPAAAAAVVAVVHHVKCHCAQPEIIKSLQKAKRQLRIESDAERREREGKLNENGTN